jgi:tryptophan-rich sensory protein
MTLFPIFLLSCSVAGAAGVLFRPGQWYRDLNKPVWTPPNWLFPVVWVVLYVLMALAATRVAALPGTQLALALWGLQITINTLWSGVFFGLHRMLAGAVTIAMLWLAVLATTLGFWRHDAIAALMMVPYLVWGTYALALNISVWLRNRDRTAAAR